MKIKEVDVFGFKSFPEKTTISFPSGITAIVGPNGCGKSNIIDAIRWAMGEHRAKQLRGTLMEDVIFNGSDRKKPTGIAEVSLLFSNDDGVIPDGYREFSEIQVTRRLFRPGESEYSINKVPCRLKDITDLFMDTGVGTRTYSILEQGKVENILNSKPENRRFLIEEAAGITKYNNRKKEALRKIDATKRNLLRLSDIIGELNRQMKSLRRQAKKAKRYNATKEEIKKIELTLAQKDYRELIKKKGVKEDSLDILKAKDLEISTTIQRNENRIEEIKIRLLEMEKEVATIQERLFEVNTSIQKTEHRIEYGNKELETLEKQQAQLEEDAGKLQFQLEATKKNITELEGDKRDLNNTLSTEELNLTERESCFNRLEKDYKTKTEKIESDKSDLIDILTEITHLKNSIANIRNQQTNLLKREEKSKEEIADAVKMTEELELETSSLEKDLEETNKLKKSLKKEREKKSGEIYNLKSALAEKRKIIEKLKGELSKKTARLNSLKELRKNLEGYQEGVRSIMLKHEVESPDKDGIYGVVADVIETEPKYETALEAVLGDKLQYIIVKSQDEGVEAIEYLKTQSAGRSSFIPLKLKEEKNSFQGISPTKADIKPLIALVKIKEGFQDIANYLLANVLVVENLKRAVKFWNNNGYIGTLVTPDGDIVGAHGVLTGGSKDAAAVGILQKKREIKELELIIKEKRKEYREAEEEYIQISEETSSIQKYTEGLIQEIHAGEVKALTLGNKLARVRSESSRLKERIEILKFEEDQLYIEKERSTLDLSTKTEGLQVQNRLRHEKESRLRSLQDEEKTLKGKIDELRDGLTDSKVRISSFKEKLKAISFNLKQLRKNQEELVGDIEIKKIEKDKNGNDFLETSKKIEDSQISLEELLQVHDDLQGFLTKKRGEIESEDKRKRKEESAYKILLKEYEEIRQRIGDLNIQITETNLHILHLEDRMEEKYHIKLKSLIKNFHTDGVSDEEINERFAYLKESLRNMGEVNLMAIDEYEELKERYEFLTDQQNDLNQSLESLHKAISKINRTTRRRFGEAFLAINEKFKEIFLRLFRGGRAELVLTDENDLLETGIDITVQPPGKNLQNINLLSGGEKTLATIALIFSIFAIKPSPFCLLDEIDASLDDHNINRFTELLAEMSKNSQFVLITHNKRTMEIADTLVGVTMEDPGVSKLVSVRMS